MQGKFRQREFLSIENVYKHKTDTSKTSKTLIRCYTWHEPELSGVRFIDTPN